MNHPADSLMQRAIKMGMQTESVGTLVVRDGDVLASSTGAIFSRPDVTAHSEIEAIRETCTSLESPRLDDCWLYTTHEPCPMCMAACCWARLDGVVYAATDDDMPEKWGTIFSAASARQIRDLCSHQPELVEEFMRKEATEIHEMNSR